MSERLNHQPEKQKSENAEIKKLKENAQEASQEKAKASRHEHADNIGEIRSRIERSTQGKQEQISHKQEREKRETDQPMLVNAELKDMAYRRTLRRTQSKLPAPSRALSKFVHNPAVEAVSELAGKTVARPSGVLSGGIFAFLGSAAFLWIARHYGYEYNYLLFALFFVGGFFAGLIIELVIRLATKRRSL